MINQHLWYCTHCNTPLTKKFSSLQPEHKPVFCCDGCKMVYQILTAHDLDQYYQIKKNTEPLGLISPVQISKNKYDYLDTPEIIKKYAYGENFKKMDFYVEGVHCVACLWLIERVGTLVPGVLSAHLDIGSSMLKISLEDKGSFSSAAEILQKLGYTPHPIDNNQEADNFRKKENKQQLLQMGTAAFCMANIMLLFISIYSGVEGILLTFFLWMSFFLILPVIFYAAIPFYKGALSSLRVRQINIDVPVSVALIIGFLASTYHLVIGSTDIYFDSLSVFVFLLLSTRIFLKSLHQKVSGNILYSEMLMPQFVSCYDEHAKDYIITPLEKISVGNIICVEEKGMIPVDGMISKGEGYIDLHMLTGESQPILVEKGEKVYAGTVNQGEKIHIQVKSAGENTRLAKIIRNIQQAKKPKIVTLADQVAQWFLLAIIALSFGVIIYFSFSNFDEGFKRALSLIIVACPCALALATPLAYMMGLKKSTSIGALLKGPEILERLALIKNIFLDKTGTLTKGGFHVLKWKILNSNDPLYAIAYYLEKTSKHPAASAIREYVLKISPDFPEIKINNYKEKLGTGVCGDIKKDHYEIKSFHKQVLNKNDGDHIQSHIGIYKNGTCYVEITLGDCIRASSYDTVKKLQKISNNVCMLSGDHFNVAKEVSRKLNIKSYEAPLDPESKQAIVQITPFSLMIGDGANDAAALASAFASISVQGSLEVSFRSSDVYLIHPGIQIIPPLLEIAHKTNSTVKRNLIISIVYNIAGITFAILGWITPLLAAIIMPISSITVLLSSYFGLHFKKEETRL